MTVHRAFSRSDLLVIMICTVLVMGLLVPVFAGGRARHRGAVSADNLRVLAASHDCYAADWNGQQYTAVPDDLAVYGAGCGEYQAGVGHDLPGIVLGWNECDGLTSTVGLWGYWAFACANQSLFKPIEFDLDRSTTPSGAFRVANCWPLHEYVSDGIGRVFDPRFYAPDDAVVAEVAEALGTYACEYPVDFELGSVPSSYVMSPAAMYHPQVLRAASVGGFRHPDSFDNGYASPAVSQVGYADLKSRLIEHHWIRNAPAGCNDLLDDGFLEQVPHGIPCLPYLFNGGADATPLTAFFDGSVSRLRTGAVAAQDARILRHTGGVDGLWSRDTTFGSDGYGGDVGVGDVTASHHILTTNGIRGRDRLR